MNTKGLRTWVLINTAHLRNNYRFFRGFIGPKCRLMAIVKSNAYGHGIVDFSQEMQRLGVDWLGVDSIIEALRLRREGIRKPILVLGHTLPENFTRAKRARISLTISTFEGIAYAARRGARFHLKVDTGMHRQGFQLREIPAVLAQMKKHRIRTSQFEGLYSHLAAPANKKFTRETKAQIAAFKKAAILVRKAGFEPLRHITATGGTLLYPEARFDMVRIGIGLYGMWPAGNLALYPKWRNRLKPILSWKTRVGEIKEVSKNDSVGYDFTHRLKRNARIAICPIGYWHGLPRALSGGKGRAIVLGHKVPILGRVSMDMVVIDLTGVPRAESGAEVMLIGEGDGVAIRAEDIAKIADTTNYEIVTRLNPLMKKFYV